MGRLNGPDILAWQCVIPPSEWHPNSNFRRNPPIPNHDSTKVRKDESSNIAPVFPIRIFVLSAFRDIGAYESLGTPTGLPDGDYNHDGIANAADYVLWRDTLGQMGIGLPANGNNTGASQDKIDQADYTPWRANFGNTVVPPSPSGTGAGATGSASAESESANPLAEPVAPEVQITRSEFAPTTFTASASRRGSSVAINQTPSASTDKRMLLAFDQALEELDRDGIQSRWLADSDDSEEEQAESELSLAAELVELW